METNRTVVDRLRRRDRLGDQNCAFCRPNRGENRGRRPRHGEKKPRYKDKH